MLQITRQFFQKGNAYTLPDPLPRRPGIILAVMLLAMSSGLVDAVVYMRHGHVFAYAMTGNLVLLGVAFASYNLHSILSHLAPVLGFACGVFIGKSLLRKFRPFALHLTLLLQIATLTLAGAFASRIPADLLVVCLAVSGAVIITVIRRAGEVAFNVTFMTGNLRAVFEGAFDTLWPSHATTHLTLGKQQFLIVGLTVIGFLGGAAIGSLSLQRLSDHTFWIADLLLIVAGWLIRRVQASEENS
ncbi:YoaK family protein [Terriglobus sp. ADX1]|uniref:YoaK family protein n=1 Tax=Terriglobus sp. ADX1 TaxID=2794063 RepID=UPI002FE5947E